MQFPINENSQVDEQTYAKTNFLDNSRKRKQKTSSRYFKDERVSLPQIKNPSESSRSSLFPLVRSGSINPQVNTVDETLASSAFKESYIEDNINEGYHPPL